MRIKVPGKVVDACDVCQGTGGYVLTKCVVCGKEYCHVCEAIMCGCVHQPDVCKVCGGDEAVKAVVERFAAPLMAVLKRRDTALRRKAKP